MSDVKIKYPATSTVDLAITLAGLATNASGVFLAGRESAAVDNTVNLDVDHLLSGVIQVSSTAPTVYRSINIYAYAPISVASGTPTYPDVLDGTNSDETITSANVMNSALRFVASIPIDATASRCYTLAPVSIASVFGGVLPKFWGVFVAHDTAQSLQSGTLSYERIQWQTV